MHEYFQDKVAVVTGAASGLGLGYCRRLLAYGARAVWMADYNEKTLAEQADALASQYPGRVFPMVVNAMMRAEIQALIDRAVNESGAIDLLFNNAGRPLTKPTLDIPVEDFEALVQLNYMGVVYGTLYALPHMARQNRGHIVNTASAGGLLPMPYQTAYASTKAAVICMTRCLSYEYADTGVFFSQVSPANVATNIFKVEVRQRLRREGVPEAEIEKRLSSIQPPKGAMPLEEALDYIFEHIEKRETDIIVGAEAREYYRVFQSDRAAFDNAVLGMAQTRRAFFEARARGENVPFPG